MKKKVFVVGGGTGYANWLPNSELVSQYEKSDVVLFTGGEDVNPVNYGEKVGKFTSFSRRDDREKIVFEDAIKNKKGIVGICRGAQLGVALQNGGSLFQHVNHPYYHKMETKGKTFVVNSLHHQMMDVKNIEGAEIVGWTENLSPMHLDGENKEKQVFENKEPEIVICPKLGGGALFIQFHPEMLYSDLHRRESKGENPIEETVDYCQNLYATVFN